MDVYVSINQICTKSEYSDEAYGPWETEHDNSFGCVRLDASYGGKKTTIPFHIAGD